MTDARGGEDVDAYWRICTAVQGEFDDASVKRRPAPNAGACPRMRPRASVEGSASSGVTRQSSTAAPHRPRRTARDAVHSARHAARASGTRPLKRSGERDPELGSLYVAGNPSALLLLETESAIGSCDTSGLIGDRRTAWILPGAGTRTCPSVLRGESAGAWRWCEELPACRLGLMPPCMTNSIHG